MRGPTLTATSPPHHLETLPPGHPDVLRRLATQLLAAAGLRAEDAAELAGHLLWFDLAGYGQQGLARLPEWLERLASGSVDPRSRPRFGTERLATAVLDAGPGPGVLALRSAALAAANKAREAGAAVVRLRGVADPIGPAAPIAADLATGPLAVLILGADDSWSLAASTAGGLPAVADSAFLAPTERLAPPWSVLLEPGDWMILAVAVPALESLSALATRLTGHDLPPAAGWLDPGDWERRRTAAFEHGLPLEESLTRTLADWASRLGVPSAFVPPASAPAKTLR
ncbi:MAG: hypothetical protein KatS3mg108_3782 [Isosphaeraceae bacterium]|jgi:ureidoglycolate dehydrogenase (NAD+)|nr:MAG: hypothetical protein KatS3mg108_3782 [Isosphaeraceae bacterium]